MTLQNARRNDEDCIHFVVINTKRIQK